METIKIRISEAGLKAVAGAERPILAQCDTCQTFVAQEEVGYRDEKVECRDCHVCGWRCDGDWEEVVHPENVVCKSNSSLRKVEIALDILEGIEGNDKVDTAQEYLSQVVHPENTRETKEPAHSHQWGNYLHTASTLVRKPQDHHCKLCDCGKLLCEVQQ